jgi:hypothetical protein
MGFLLALLLGEDERLAKASASISTAEEDKG